MQWSFSHLVQCYSGRQVWPPPCLCPPDCGTSPYVLPDWAVQPMPTDPRCPIPALYPTPQIPSSLAWDKLRDHSGRWYAPPSAPQESGTTKVTGSSVWIIMILFKRHAPWTTLVVVLITLAWGHSLMIDNTGSFLYTLSKGLFCMLWEFL